MVQKKREHSEIKTGLHPRNLHAKRYDFKALTESSPDLEAYVIKNKYGDTSIDFSDPKAVKALNSSLLHHFYNLTYWDIPRGYLCPPVPGRADYIHHIADLLASINNGHIPKGEKVKILDIGIGASAIYPIIGHQSYGWSFVGSEIDEEALGSAKKIIDSNPDLSESIELRLQENPNDIFRNIIKTTEFFHCTICNPPFHTSLAASQAGNIRKIRNLSGKRTDAPKLNFGGKEQELWCNGGEKRFVRAMITQSKKNAQRSKWFTSLISKEENLEPIYRSLKRAEAVEVKTIPLNVGNKTSRIVAWRFF